MTQGDQDERLARAISRYAATSTYDYPRLFAPEFSASRLPNPFGRQVELGEEPFRALMLLIQGTRFLHLRGEIDFALLRCESAIEELALLSLWAAGSAQCEDVIVADSVRRFSCFGMLAIQPQYSVPPYRADFLVSYGSMEYLSAEPKRFGWRESRALVECDGHDYHERTKSQARHDRKRDRDLQAAGWKVYRYTGSELWADPLKCALEVVVRLQEAAQASPIVDEMEDSRR